MNPEPPEEACRQKRGAQRPCWLSSLNHPALYEKDANHCSISTPNEQSALHTEPSPRELLEKVDSS